MGAALSAPVINDVSTDLEDPPAFQKSSHAASLPDGVKAACRKHYARLQPLRVPGGDTMAVFAAAKRAAATLPNTSVVLEDGAAGALSRAAACSECQCWRRCSRAAHRSS